VSTNKQRRKIMNTKRNFLTAAATTAIVGLASIAPAQAASFGTSGINFDKDTTVEFGFNKSVGLYRSELRVFELGADGNAIGDGYNIFNEVQAHDAGNGTDYSSIGGEPLGSCGITVLECETSFTFEGGKNYTLGLFSYHRTSGSLKTKSFLNNKGYYSYYKDGKKVEVNNNDQLFLLGSWGSETDTTKILNPGDYAEGYDLLGDLLKIGIDDSGNNQDGDYNDFQITAKVASTPEPTVLLGLAVAAGGMFMTRRNKNKAS
jgi:hypothetical protein